MQKYDTSQLQKYDILGPCQERDRAPFPSEGVSKRYADYEFNRLARGVMASLTYGYREYGLCGGRRDNGIR